MYGAATCNYWGKETLVRIPQDLLAYFHYLIHDPDTIENLAR